MCAYLAIVAEFLLEALAWRAIALRNGLPSLGMGAFFRVRRPQILMALRADALET